MEETGSGGNWVLLWWAEAVLNKSLVQFSADGRCCVPSLLLGLKPDYGRSNGGNGDLLPKELTTSRLVPRTVVFSGPDLEAGHCRYTPPPETPGHSQASVLQSFVGSLLLSPASWCAQDFVCALQESVSPVLWKFCNQIPLAFKVKFPGDSQSFCQMPRLGNLL